MPSRGRETALVGRDEDRVGMYGHADDPDLGEEENPLRVCFSDTMSDSGPAETVKER